MDSQRFYSTNAENTSPMKAISLFEGLKTILSQESIIGFDIETFSPHGFPERMEDPIVNFSLGVPFVRCSRIGLVVVSLICDPYLEKDLLDMLYQFLSFLGGACLVTYNGSKFDVKYVIHRGNFFGLDFGEVFAGLFHVDLFKLVRWLHVRLPSYSQRTVEKFIGVDRVVKDVSGASYYSAFVDFLTRGSLKPLLYNIEDSTGCLQIANRLFPALKENHCKFYK